MKSRVKYIAGFLCICFFISCKQSNNSTSDKETILKGSTTILVDETLKPILDDQVEVFESLYKAKINIVAKSEKEVIRAFLKDSTRIVMLSRPLDAEEVKFFKRLKITPRITEIGSDAIAFIANKQDSDTVIDLEAVVSFIQGKQQARVKGLVFDNLNSSTVRYINSLAGVKSTSAKGIYSFNTNEEVAKYVSENRGMIGVIGLNWLYRPSLEMEKYLKNINVLSVKGVGQEFYVAPTQNNLAEGIYPLARDLYIINCQGYSGLGMGFASFIAGDIGQRIILKSGLLPIRTPGRKIIITTKSKLKEK